MSSEIAASILIYDITKHIANFQSNNTSITPDSITTTIILTEGRSFLAMIDSGAELNFIRKDLFIRNNIQHEKTHILSLRIVDVQGNEFAPANEPVYTIEIITVVDIEP